MSSYLAKEMDSMILAVNKRFLLNRNTILLVRLVLECYSICNTCNMIMMWIYMTPVDAHMTRNYLGIDCFIYH
jgi:hypothetical protein